MNVIEAMKTRRTIRKFTGKAIPSEILADIVDCARLAPYPANIQPLKFAIADDDELTDRIFPCTGWAGYLENGAPASGETPKAYIIILGDRDIKPNGDFKCETGIAGSHICLAAFGHGVASCWIGSVDRDRLTEILQLPSNLIIQDIVALGYPMQESRACDMADDIKYYLDTNNVLNVPKRSLDEVIV